MQSKDENELDFFEQMGDVKPLAQDKINNYSPLHSITTKQKLAKQHAQNPRDTTPLTLESVQPLKPDDFLSYKQPGIQDGVFKNLRLGKYTLDQKIVLNGLKLKDAATTLYHAIKKGHGKGQRALLIQHRKGENSQPFPAYKKSYVNHWLRQIEEVIAFHTATAMHGGLGATYVLLKKHPEQKLINRELNRRR